VFEHRRHVEVLREAGATFDEATLAGGGARSGLWPQIFADCLGMRIRVAEADETGALGAALGAGIGVGLFADYEDAVRCMTRIRRSFEPNAGIKPQYDHRYDTYGALGDALQDFWSRQQSAATMNASQERGA
jgi:L-xylulokinase